MIILARYNLAAWVEVPLYEVLLIIINWFDSLLILNKHLYSETVLTLMLQTQKFSSAACFLIFLFSSSTYNLEASLLIWFFFFF